MVKARTLQFRRDDDQPVPLTDLAPQDWLWLDRDLSSL